MITNGLDILLAAEPLPPGLLAEARRTALTEQRFAIVKEREGLIIRYRVQTLIGAEKEALAGLLKAIEQCELGLRGVEEIAREWGMGSVADEERGS